MAWENVTQLLPGIVFLIALGSRAYREKDKDENIETGLLLLQPILVGVWGGTGEAWLISLLFNIYTIGCILYLLLIKGNQEKSLSKLRGGTWMLCMYALIKLFSADVALLTKGVGFIVAGIALLGANIWLSNHTRRGQNE